MGSAALLAILRWDHQLPFMVTPWEAALPHAMHGSNWESLLGSWDLNLCHRCSSALILAWWKQQRCQLPREARHHQKSPESLQKMPVTSSTALEVAGRLLEGDLVESGL